MDKQLVVPRARMSPSRSVNGNGLPSKGPPAPMGKRAAIAQGIRDILSPASSMMISPGSSSLTSPSLSPSNSIVNGLSSASRRVSTASPMLLAATEGLGAANENVTVTVRFRPLSFREIQRGDDVSWYADGDKVVRMESNPRVAYAYDRVFGPATSTRGVYDVAAQPIVNDAMEGINGTVFAYGVTSSGKTHTMHGDQKSPGVIPLAVKEVFSIIQETPGREFLLRVSYLEIYNEVINDLLNPASQNLRIREDGQLGTYVENIKEEVVLSAAHALSLIAAGEEHRHVGSTNFNLMSSRSHTIFTMTIESTGRDKQGFEEVSLSQLNLIDLAGSESSKAATTGVRRKEGAYINKSLLTLGTVIAKLSEAKHGHIPYRDSKLTRLLQSSLSGNGRISLICTVTPASGAMEETHNTLKFAHRAKHVIVRAETNRIMDEKSLIKKYQRVISELKQELLRVKKGILSPIPSGGTPEDLTLLCEKMEADKELMQSRLEEEEQEKAALLGRIQRLTKLILVSTKTNVEPPPDKHSHRRRLSFGEEDLAYLKMRKMEMTLDDKYDVEGDMASDGSSPIEETEEKKSKRRPGVLSWLKLKRTSPSWSSDSGDAAASLSSVKSSRVLWPNSPVKGSELGEPLRRMSSPGHRRAESSGSMMTRSDSTVEPIMQPTQAGELFSTTSKGRQSPRINDNVADQIELLKEQLKILSGEVALCGSNLKRMAEHMSPGIEAKEEEKQHLEDEIKEKRKKMRMLEQKIETARLMQPIVNGDVEDMAKALGKMKALLSDKTFEMEIINADNRILQDSLRAKTKQNNRLLEEINLLRVELTRAIQGPSNNSTAPSPRTHIISQNSKSFENLEVSQTNSVEENATTGSVSEEGSRQEGQRDQTVASENGEGNGVATGREDSEAVLAQIVEVESLRMQLNLMAEDHEMLTERQHHLTADLAEARALAVMRPGNVNNSLTAGGYKGGSEPLSDMTRLLEQLAATKERETSLRVALAGKEAVEAELDALKSELASLRGRGSSGTNVSPGTEQQVEGTGEQRKEDVGGAEMPLLTKLEAALTAKAEQVAELERESEEAKLREAGLENDLATMWVLVAELRRHNALSREGDGEHEHGNEEIEKKITPNVEAVQRELERERKRNESLEANLARVKGDSLEGLPLETVEELVSLHQEALAKLAFFKAGTCPQTQQPGDRAGEA